MKATTTTNITEEDWEKIRAQLRVLVDVYCELNNDVVKIKDLLKKIVKVMCKKEKTCAINQKKENTPSKKSGKRKSS